MTKSTVSLVLSLIVLLAFSVQSSESFSLSPKPLTAFLSRNREQTIMQKQVPSSQGEANRVSDKQSLDEFNALCQQVIAEERKQHYRAFVADCGNRTF